MKNKMKFFIQKNPKENNLMALNCMCHHRYLLFQVGILKNFNYLFTMPILFEFSTVYFYRYNIFF